MSARGTSIRSRALQRAEVAPVSSSVAAPPLADAAPLMPLAETRSAAAAAAHVGHDEAAGGAGGSTDYAALLTAPPIRRPIARGAASLTHATGAGAARAADAADANALIPLPLPQLDDAGSADAGVAAAAASSRADYEEADSAMAAARAPRPVALTRHGLRQFVESEHGLRMYIQNCVGTCNLGCTIDLAHVAAHARNAEYNPQRFSAAILRLREPKAACLLFGTGKLCVTGVKNEDDARLGARKVAKIMQMLGFAAACSDFRIQNLVATGDCGFPIRLEGLADAHSRFSSYEPELFPGLIYRLENPRVVFLVFVSGRIVITGARNRSNIVDGLQKLYPVLYSFRKAAASTVPQQDVAAAAAAAAAAAYAYD